jgi:hypothetical protein
VVHEIKGVVIDAVGISSHQTYTPTMTVKVKYGKTAVDKNCSRAKTKNNLMKRFSGVSLHQDLPNKENTPRSLYAGKISRDSKIFFGR